MEGPTFQLGANFFYHLCALIQLNVHKVNPERISQACPKNFCSKIFVVAFVSSWANLKTNLGSYTQGNLQLQATVSSNINGFLARLQPLHLDHDYVWKGRSNISKSTLFILEAWQRPYVFEAWLKMINISVDRLSLNGNFFFCSSWAIFVICFSTPPPE